MTIKTGKAKGGVARAEALDPERRKEIARIAASARWSGDIPKANYEGMFNIAGVEIPCAVIEQGDKVIRVIVQREVVGLLTLSKKGNLDRYLQAKNYSRSCHKNSGESLLNQAVIVAQNEWQ